MQDFNRIIDSAHIGMVLTFEKCKSRGLDVSAVRADFRE